MASGHMGGFYMVDPYRPLTPPAEADAPDVDLINGRVPTEHERTVVEAAILAERERGSSFITVRRPR